MKRMLAAAVLFAVAMGAGADIVPNGHMWFWQDEFGDPYDGYIEASPGDTVTVWHVGNNNGGSWQGLGQIRTELWWDTAVIANPGSGDGTAYVTPSYGDPDPGFGSHVTNPPGHNYGAAPDYSTPQYNHYLKLDFYFNYMWAYEGMAVNAYHIPIRPDAPLGETTLGGRFIGVHAYGYTQWWDEIGDGDPYQLTINVVGLFDPGDFDQDGDVDADDVDILCANMGGDLDPYDVNDDGVVDEDDMVYHIETLIEYDTDDDGTPDGNGTYQGDFNLDGVVNATDLQLMKGSFGTTGVGYAAGNANCDTVVNATDLQILKGTFGSVVTGAVPEPLTIGLVAAGGLALLRRPRR